VKKMEKITEFLNDRDLNRDGVPPERMREQESNPTGGVLVAPGNEERLF
jgi:hypothetical protein